MTYKSSSAYASSLPFDEEIPCCYLPAQAVRLIACTLDTVLFDIRQSRQPLDPTIFLDTIRTAYDDTMELEAALAGEPIQATERPFNGPTGSSLQEETQAAWKLVKAYRAVLRRGNADRIAEMREELIDGAQLFEHFAARQLCANAANRAK